MLEELLIRDVGVIQQVDLRFGPGLTVLTGETGAGKTMVVSALELLLGARADPMLVRTGASRAIVEGRLVPPPPGSSAWQDDGDDDLVVVREVSVADDTTRSRARIGGRLAPVSALSSLVRQVVEIHGQSDAHRLSEERVQRELLDRFGGEGLAQAGTDYTQAWRVWERASAELRELETRTREHAREIDRLEAELAEIDAVAPEPDEDATIEAELRRLEHREALLEAGRSASHAIVAEGAARDHLGAAVAALRAVGGIDDTLTELSGRVEALAAEAQDVALDLVDYADGLDVDPDHLDALRTRRAALRGLIRKYGEDVAAVTAYAEHARQAVGRLRHGDERRRQLAGDLQGLTARLEEAAAALHARRRTAGDNLAAAVDAHLRDLAMAHAAFTVEVSSREPGPTGADRVRFLLAANPGEPSLPVSKAASGGEQSRVALALRLSLAQADDAGVLVFDEVDAGVGGAVALVIGEKLARLSRGRQVLCVTHLAQLAAYADHHFVVDKLTEHGRTQATVEGVSGPARVRELSRLLSGRPDSEVAADHAAELRASAMARLAG